jgi:hypothetical protein
VPLVDNEALFYNCARYQPCPSTSMHEQKRHEDDLAMLIQLSASNRCFNPRSLRLPAWGNLHILCEWKRVVISSFVYFCGIIKLAYCIGRARGDDILTANPTGTEHIVFRGEKPLRALAAAQARHRPGREEGRFKAPLLSQLAQAWRGDQMYRYMKGVDGRREQPKCGRSTWKCSGEGG